MASIVFGALAGSWSVGGSWVGGIAPTSSDDAVLHAASGACTIDTNVACRSLDCTGLGISPYASTLTHNAAANLSIGSSTAGASNIALAFVAGMTYVLVNAATSAISFVSTSTTQQTIDAQGKTLGNATFNGTGSNYAFISALSSTAVFSHLSGALHIDGVSDASGLSFSFGAFTSTGALTRSLLLGTSTITVANVNGWLTSGSNMSLNSGTSTIIMTSASCTFSVLGAQTYYNVTLSGSSGNTTGASTTISNNLLVNGSGIFTNSFSLTCLNFTRNGTAIKTDAWSLAANVTVTGILTIAGNSSANRLIVQSSTVGTQRTINNTGATMSISNTDFMDIATSTTWNASARTDIGDALGNSGITFPASLNDVVSMSTNQSWSTVGIHSIGRLPLPQDNVSMSGVAGGILTTDMPRLGANIDWTGATGSPTWVATIAGTGTTNGPFVFGNITLISGMTVNTTNILDLRGRGSQSLTTASRNVGSLVFNSFGGTYTLQDALTASNNGVTLNRGTLTTQNFSLSINSYVQNGGICNPGSSTITLLSTSGTPWNTGLGTFNGATATIVFLSVATATRTFSGGNASAIYGTLQYNVANSPGALAITGANTINQLIVGPGRILTFPSSTITTITGPSGFQCSGSPNGYLYLPGVASNNATSSDAPALGIIGNITIDGEVALPSWSSPAVASVIAAKWSSNSNISYRFLINSGSGLLQFVSTADGSTQQTSSSNAATGFSPGVTGWVRVSFVANDSVGHRVATFFTSPDGVTWTQLGSVITTVGATSIFNSNSPLEIGTFNSGTSAAAMSVNRVRIYSSALGSGSGTPVFDAVFNSFGVNSFTESSSNAATVIINGALAKQGDGRLSIISSSTGTAATLTHAAFDVENIDYAVITDNIASNVLGVSWNAGHHSTLLTNVSGWGTGIGYAFNPTSSNSNSVTLSKVKNLIRASSNSVANTVSVSKTVSFLRSVAISVANSVSLARKQALQRNSSLTVNNSTSVQTQKSLIRNLSFSQNNSTALDSIRGFVRSSASFVANSVSVIASSVHKAHPALRAIFQSVLRASDFISSLRVSNFISNRRANLFTATGSYYGGDEQMISTLAYPGELYFGSTEIKQPVVQDVTNRCPSPTTITDVEITIYEQPANSLEMLDVTSEQLQGTYSLVGGVNSVTVTNTGSGYLDVPTVTFDPATYPGKPATAHAIIDNQMVSEIVIDSPGFAYANAPFVYITSPTGSSALANCTISQTQILCKVGNGSLNVGSTYFIYFDVTFSDERTERVITKGFPCPA